MNPPTPQPTVQRRQRHIQFTAEVREPPFILAQQVVGHTPGTGPVQTTPPEQMLNHRLVERITALGRPPALTVERFGYLNGGQLLLGQCLDTIQQLWVITQLIVSGYRTSQLAVAHESSGKMDCDIHPFALGVRGDHDTFDQAPHDLLTVGCGRMR